MLTKRAGAREQPVHAVALDRIVDVSHASAALRAVLGPAGEEATHRVAAIGTRPLVVAVLREAAALAAAEALRGWGLPALAIAVHEPLPGLVVARDFTLGERSSWAGAPVRR
ncbi:MAG: hypothetical protein U0168_24605 [Nannocystaceae bacterium]